MNEGLYLDMDEFMSLSSKKQLCVLYQNLLDIKKQTKNFNFKVKWLYAWVGTLSTLSLGFAVWLVNKLF
jgi:hypothetical protein